MTYTKPEVTQLGSAVAVIETLSTVKPPSRFLDANRHVKNAISAYDLDE